MTIKALTVRDLKEFLARADVSDDAILAATEAGATCFGITFVGAVEGAVVFDMHPDCEDDVHVDWQKLKGVNS